MNRTLISRVCVNVCTREKWSFVEKRTIDTRKVFDRVAHFVLGVVRKINPENMNGNRSEVTYNA